MLKLLDILSNFFQQNFQIIINNQIYKSGKLILLSHKEFYIKLIYLDKKHNKQRTFELPLPFDFELNNNILILDYTNNTFCNNNSNLLIELQKINNNYNHHAFYNKKIILKFSNLEF